MNPCPWRHPAQGPERELLQDCVLRPGEALYFPSHWWHATINVGETVFMSSFLAPGSAPRGAKSLAEL